MSQVDIGFSERISADYTVTASSYQTVGSPSLPDTTFVAGKKYLLLVRAEVKSNVVGTQIGCQLIHGSTAFTRSEQLCTTNSLQERSVYAYLTVWTAVSGEGVGLQIKSDGTNEVRFRWASLVAIRLSDTLTENTHWFYNENTAPITLTTSHVTHATLTWTPPVAGHRWLVLTDGDVTIDQTGGSDQFVVRLDETGGATASWEHIMNGRASGDNRLSPHCWWGTLGAVSQTFRVQAKRIGTTGSTAQLRRSAVFALDLELFDVVTAVFDDTHVEGAVGAFNTLAATVSHAQAVAGGNVLLLGAMSFDPQTTSVGTFLYARAQMDNVDVYSVDGVANTYSDQTGTPRFQTPGPGSGQAWPYVVHSVRQLTGTHAIDVDFGLGASNAHGVKFRRLLAISLDVASSPPPAAGAGAANPPERNEQIMWVNDYRASRRRVRIRCRDATDNTTPEIAEAGGQGAISVNGGAFTTTGVGVLVAEEASNGLYYAELTQAAIRIPPGSSVRFRYKSAATALETVTFPVEECPWLDDGVAAAGGANFLDLQATEAGERTVPTVIQVGSVIRTLSGTGGGQSQMVGGFSGVRMTTEKNWDVAPAADTRYVVLPGLPPTVPDVNVLQLGGDATAQANLKAGALAMLTGAIVAGTNTTTTITTNLPITVGGVTTPTDHYKGRAVYFYSTGSRPGDVAIITGSSVVGANTVLTVDTLAAAPAVGNPFVVT